MTYQLDEKCLSSNPAYVCWKSMKARCVNSNRKDYSRYGGRGVKVCAQWMNSFENFLKDMGERPSKDHSLDRIDPAGNYEPGQCKWSTSKQQSRNRRSNTLLTHKGKTQCIAAWAEELDLKQPTICKRLARGWSIERALSVKVA